MGIPHRDDAQQQHDDAHDLPPPVSFILFLFEVEVSIKPFLDISEKRLICTPRVSYSCRCRFISSRLESCACRGGVGANTSTREAPSSRVQKKYAGTSGDVEKNNRT